MMGTVRTSLLLLMIWLGAGTCQTINRDVEVQCYKNSKDGTLSTKFTSELMGDDINFLFGLELIPNMDPPMYMKNDDCNAEITDERIELVSTIGLFDSTLSSNTCGCEMEMSTGATQEVLSCAYHIALRQVQSTYLHYTDRDYNWTCSADTATDTWLRTTVQVTAPLEEPLEPLQPTISFNIIGSNNDNIITSCNAGDLIRGQIILELSGYQDYLTPWGLYSFSLMVNSVNDFGAGSGARYLTEVDGCRRFPNILALQYGFILDGLQVTGSQRNLVFTTTTGLMRCRKIPGVNNNALFFSTTVGTCSGSRQPPGRDERCEDYCSHNTAGRKRRQAKEDYKHFVTSITIIDEPEVSKTEEVSSVVLIVVPIVVGFALIVLILAVVFYCCWATRNREVRKRKLDSRASSERSIPAKF